MVVFFHLVFAAFLVVLIYAMAKQGESTELLIKGLDLARKADDEAARDRLAIMMRSQHEANEALCRLIKASQSARAESSALISDGVRVRGSGQPVGHAEKKGL